MELHDIVILSVLMVIKTKAVLKKVDLDADTTVPVLHFDMPLLKWFCLRLRSQPHQHRHIHFISACQCQLLIKTWWQIYLRSYARNEVQMMELFQHPNSSRGI